MKKYEKIVPDTSVIIEGILSKKLNKEIKAEEIIIHNAVLSELEHQANKEKAIGHLGIEEIKNLRKKDITLSFKGKKPHASEIKYASLGEIDSLIRDLAYEEGATLFTRDKVQAKIAEAKGIPTEFIQLKRKAKKLILDSYFDKETMSVHIKENTLPYAKKGFPGDWKFLAIDKIKIKQDKIKKISTEIIEEAKIRRDSFIEIEREGSTIIQLGTYRITILRPPFSDGWEITAVRPVKKLKLNEYPLSEKLKERIIKQAEGILIAGAPGHGKCLPGETKLYTKNFQAISIREVYEKNIDFLLGINKEGKVVKTKVQNKNKRLTNQLIALKTGMGRTIKATGNHPFLRYKESKIEWVDLQEIKKGDKIAILKSFKKTGNYDQLNLIKYYDQKETLCEIEKKDLSIPIEYKYNGKKRKIIKEIKRGTTTAKKVSKIHKLNHKYTRSIIFNLIKEGIINETNKKLKIKKNQFNLKEHPYLFLEDINKIKPNLKIIRVGLGNHSKRQFIKLPQRVTPELCRLLGYYLSEGGGDKFSFTNKNPLLKTDFKICLEKALGIKNIKENKLTYYLNFYKVLEPLMKNWGCSLKLKQKSRNMELPKFLMRCNEENLYNFLGAYFDGDGHINKNNKSLDYDTSSQKAANQLIKLLSRINIFASLQTKEAKGWMRHTVTIQNKLDILRFYKYIPLLQKDKNKIKKILEKKEYTQTNSYNLTLLLKELSILKPIKKKINVSLERGYKLIQEYYKLFFEYTKNAEEAILELKQINLGLKTLEENIQKNNHKLNYSTLKNNKIDHRSLYRWKKGQKRKLSTSIKINKIINCPVFINEHIVGKCIEKTLELCKISQKNLSQKIGTSQGTISLRTINGWNCTTIETIKTVKIIEEIYLKQKQEMISHIKTLSILFESGILFDKIKEIKVEEGITEVYDIETNTHNFLAGEIPLIVHNSTFASALALEYLKQDKIVKTIEAPRDLVLPEEITQLAMSHGTPDEIHDILLLSRPDYTLFDEMRNTKDFLLFSDLRLSGIGLLGVMHATNPIDAIQRFVGRVELGMIPHIIDTVIFIKNGEINKILSLQMTVKVPSGMTESDLARPIVTISDFETGKLEYEIYSYGEETVVVPVTGQLKQNPLQELAAKQLRKELKKYADNVEVKFISDNKVEVQLPKDVMASFIGKQGANISKIEKEFGLSIDAKELSSKPRQSRGSKKIRYDIKKHGNNLNIYLAKSHAGREAEVFVEGRYLFSAAISKKGVIKVNTRSKLGQTLMQDVKKDRKLEIKI